MQHVQRPALVPEPQPVGLMSQLSGGLLGLAIEESVEQSLVLLSVQPLRHNIL
ncbi:hypothetical protein F2Q70_00015227 [Brassica cretica]|uniref:Uncharacterized protein n=1 Tax=Brassica cretica TaxID=69181 RepID=A0A8S9KTG2_BRACR|nr:hypothetical protein F2Q70_00015227 [Brassica cretica]KAF2598291.1 hypothetical protein F2Q68_00008321 [Brassica cretica]KAF2598294.1 hypothetical protein F2Q68_00008322 [Brassica cretica]